MELIAKDTESDLFLKTVAEKETSERRAKIAEATSDFTISFEYSSRTFNCHFYYEEKESDLTKKVAGVTLFSIVTNMMQEKSREYAIITLLELDLKNTGFLENMIASKASFKVTVNSKIGIDKQEKISVKDIKPFADMSHDSKVEYYLTQNCEQVNKSMLPLDIGDTFCLKSFEYKNKSLVYNIIMNEEYFEMAKTIPEYLKIMLCSRLVTLFTKQFKFFTGNIVFELQKGVLQNKRLVLPIIPQSLQLSLTTDEQKEMAEHPLDETDMLMYGVAGGVKMAIAQSKKKGEKIEFTDIDYHDKTMFYTREAQNDHFSQLITRIGKNKEECDIYGKGHILNNEKYFKENAEKGVGLHMTLKNANNDFVAFGYSSKDLLSLYALPQHERDSIICLSDILNENVSISMQSHNDKAFFPKNIALEGNNIVIVFVARGQRNFKWYSMGLTTKGYDMLRNVKTLRSLCLKLKKNFVFRVVSDDGKQKRQEIISWTDIR